MKRKNTLSWISQKISKSSYENLSLHARYIPQRNYIELIISIKDLPVEYRAKLSDSFVKVMGAEDFDRMFSKLDKHVSDLLPITVHSEKVLVIDLCELEELEDIAAIRATIVSAPLKHLSLLEKNNVTYHHKSPLIVARYTNKRLYVSIHFKRNAGTFITLAKGFVDLDCEWTQNDFDIFVINLETLFCENKELLEEAVRFNVLIDISQVQLKLSSEDMSGSLFGLIQKSVSKSTELKNREKVYKKMVAEHSFHELYERNSSRKITIVCAPTNSGKTYHGTQLIKQALRENESSHCVMLFPLRVLALQIQDDMIADGIPTSMITGEEQSIIEGAPVDAMTVEIFDTDKIYDTVFLDEGQLAFGAERSSGYLRVICGAKCKHLIISCAPAALPQMEWYLDQILNVGFETITLQRLTPLEVLKNEISYSEIKDGDLVVAFSRKAIHELAAKISNNGLNVGIMYGALSPSARRSMLRRYRENGYQILVASDSIGMGISAPAKRVLFAEIEKFDGQSVRELKDEEYRQIAGRAGRFGYAEFGETGVLSGNSPKNLIRVIESEPELLDPPSKLYVTPDKNQLLAAEDIGLVKALSVWSNAIKKSGLYSASSEVMGEFTEKASWLDGMVADKNITYSESVRLLYVTFPMNGKGSKLPLYKSLVASACENKKIPIPVSASGRDVRSLENLSADITLMIQLSGIFPDSFPSQALLNKQQNSLGEAIAKHLERQYTNN